MPIRRDDRRSGANRARNDHRTPFQIDRDRILYSMAFRRLAGVTQVVSPHEGEVFHNRYTHSIKVAQVARRIAEYFLCKFPDEAKSWGELDPDVVEAAALAHDLGHPPFGHIAEEELAQLVSTKLCQAYDLDHSATNQEGYEGNAQSFRVITDLGIRRLTVAHGLDLTRATLNATLKYPWKFQENPANLKKYGYYAVDTESFLFARQTEQPQAPEVPFNNRTVEAQIMDWADDITYSVHDTEDFYMAGLIPLERLMTDQGEQDRFLESIQKRSVARGKPIDTKATAYQLESRGLFNVSYILEERYTGSRKQQQVLYSFASTTIARFLNETRLLPFPGQAGKALEIPENILMQVSLLKELTWTYVIENPSFAATQYGQRKAIRKLFEVFLEAVEEKQWTLLPAAFRERAVDLSNQHWPIPIEIRLRLVADTIASLTDVQAMLIFHRLTGVSQASMLD